MSSRAIVTCAGGPNGVYFINGAINFLMLHRHLGWKGGLVWAHINDMKEEWIEWLSSQIPGLQFINLGGDPLRNNVRGAGGWQAKPQSIRKALDLYDEVMFLDADSFPVGSVDYLFEHPMFTSSEMLLWNDGPHYWTVQRTIELEMLFGVRPPQRQVESGQMMFKCLSKVKAALDICIGMNLNHGFTYAHLYGDKDTFLISALKAGMELGHDLKITPVPYSGIQGGMLQLDPDGKPFTCHLSTGKWSPHHSRPYVRERYYPLQQKAVKISEEIRALFFKQKR